MKKVKTKPAALDELKGGQTPKMICPACKATAVLAPDGAGGRNYVCSSCGRRFRSSRSMS